MQSYQGAQIFEAVGLSQDVIDRYFTGTQSKISGISIEQIDNENKARQSNATDYLESGSTFQWRQQGQHHAFNPRTIFYYNMLVEKMIMNCLKNFQRQSMINVQITYVIC